MTKTFAVIGDLIAESRQGSIVPGGGGAIALALRELGAHVTFRSRIGNDDKGDAVMSQLKAAWVHPGLIDRIDDDSCSLTRNENGSVSEWHQGVFMTKDGVMDIYALFGHSAVILDLRDQSLRQFLIDLPAHTDGTVRMLTTLDHLELLDPHAEELDIAMRCDTVVGTESQFVTLTGASSASEALGMIFERMPGTHIQTAVAITNTGLEIVARDARILKPVQHAIPSLLVPQVTAGIAWAMANHADWEVATNVCLDPSAIK